VKKSGTVTGTLITTHSATRAPHRRTGQRGVELLTRSSLRTPRTAGAGAGSYPAPIPIDAPSARPSTGRPPGSAVKSPRRTSGRERPDSDELASADAALVDVFRSILPELRLTLTWDQGTEMAQHLAITADTGTKIYFCDSGSPWQRGTNENTNGLLRQYFPKSTDLSVHTPGDLARVEAELNRRPRITLNDRAPAELFTALLRSRLYPLLQ